MSPEDTITELEDLMRGMKMNGGAVKLQHRLLGRAEMCLNNAKRHPDQHVRDENIIRHKAYLAAADDARTDDECNALVDLWKAVAAAECHLQGAEFEKVRAALYALNDVWKSKK